MVVDGKGGQSRYIDAIFHRFVDSRRQFGIESVDAFDQQDRIIVEAYLLTAVLTFSEFKVIVWQLYFLTCDQAVEIFVEFREIEGIE